MGMKRVKTMIGGAAKLWLLLPVCIAALCLLSACGSKTSSSNASVSTVLTGKQDPFGKYDPVITITASRIMQPTLEVDQNDPDRRSYDSNIWNRVFLEQLGVKLEYKWISTDSASDVAKWNAAIASGDVPDFALVSDQVYKLLVDADFIADMGDILENYGSDDYLATVTTSGIQEMTINGVLRGFPGTSKAMAASSMLFVRQDWLDKVSLPLPETIDDVLKIARAFKAAKLGGNDTIGLMFSNNLTGGSNFTAADGKWDTFFNAYGAYLNYWLNKDGKLVYSNTLPEIREPLLVLQALYKEGLINRDLAVTNDTLAREYVASGKTGIFYSSAWNVNGSMGTLYKSDPEHVKIVNLPPPPAVKGKEYPIQTNSPKAMRIFVSNKSKNPEAVVKMSNLSVHHRLNNFVQYITDEKGFNLFKFLPWDQVSSTVTDDLDKSVAVREYVLHNTPVTNGAWQNTLAGYLRAVDGGPDLHWYIAMFGPEGSYSTLYDMYQQGKILWDSYNGLPTETQALKGDTIRDELNSAMYEVVMGADYSVYQRAVDRWFTNGGTQITEEVNAWYKSLGK
jgi:putative aldouronate transport system substrate-binding protein